MLVNGIRLIETSLPFGSYVREKLSQLFYLSSYGCDVEIRWEQVSHFEKEERRKGSRNKTIVDGVTEGSPIKSVQRSSAFNLGCDIYRYSEELRKMERQLDAASLAWKAISRCSKGILSQATPRKATQTSQSLA